MRTKRAGPHILTGRRIVVDKNTLPPGALQEILLDVPGLFCAFAHGGRIVALETLGRNVFAVS